MQGATHSVLQIFLPTLEVLLRVRALYLKVQEWRFLVLNIFSCSRDIQDFVQRVMTPQIVSYND